MQYKCDVCHDSGSKNQTGDYLDCPACDMPMIRKALNDFVKSLGPTHPEDVALAIHQRALAMAPKQERELFVSDFKQDGSAIGGTLSQTLTDMNSIEQDMKEAPAAANGALTDEQVVCALGCIANGRNTGHISTKNAKVVQEFIRAAAGHDAALVALIHKAQSILSRHLPPGGPDAKTTISALLYLLDGPESRAALSGAKGN